MSSGIVTKRVDKKGEPAIMRNRSQNVTGEKVRSQKGGNGPGKNGANRTLSQFVGCAAAGEAGGGKEKAGSRWRRAGRLKSCWPGRLVTIGPIGNRGGRCCRNGGWLQIGLPGVVRGGAGRMGAGGGGMLSAAGLFQKPWWVVLPHARKRGKNQTGQKLAPNRQKKRGNGPGKRWITENCHRE